MTAKVTRTHCLEFETSMYRLSDDEAYEANLVPDLYEEIQDAVNEMWHRVYGQQLHSTSAERIADCVLEILIAKARVTNEVIVPLELNV